MVVIHGDVDDLADMKDVTWLLDEKESGLRGDLVLFKKLFHLGHGSFMLAKDMSFMHDVLKTMQDNQIGGEKVIEYMI